MELHGTTQADGDRFPLELEAHRRGDAGFDKGAFRFRDHLVHQVLREEDDFAEASRAEFESFLRAHVDVTDLKPINCTAKLIKPVLNCTHTIPYPTTPVEFVLEDETGLRFSVRVWPQVLAFLQHKCGKSYIDVAFDRQPPHEPLFMRLCASMLADGPTSCELF